MPVKQLKDFLNKENVKYVCISHSPAYTAQQTAESAHISGDALAKVVLVKIDGDMAMIVTPASSQVKLAAFKETVGANDVELASESEFSGKFPGCDVGAMPPFGNLFGMKTYVVDGLANNDQIIFNAGSHLELVQLAYADFERLVKPEAIKI